MSDRNGKIFCTSIASLSHISKYSEYVKKDMSVYKEESTWDAFSMYNHSFDGGESWVEFNNEVTMIATGDGTEDE